MFECVGYRTTSAVQLVIAPPMAWHAASTRTKLLSFIILLMLRRQSVASAVCLVSP